MLRASEQIYRSIKIAAARRESFARHQNVYLRRYRVYIRPTLRVCTTSRHDARRGAVKPGGRRYFSTVSSRCLGAYRFQGWNSFTRICATASCACLLANLVIDRIHALPPSRALLIGRINFVIKSSRIITEHEIMDASIDRQFHVMTRLLRTNYSALYRRIDRIADSPGHRQPPSTYPDSDLW